MYTVPSTYVPPAQPPQPEINQSRNVPANSKLSSLSNDEVDAIIKQIIVVQIEALQNELQEYRTLSSKIMHNVSKISYLQLYFPNKVLSIENNANKFIYAL